MTIRVSLVLLGCYLLQKWRVGGILDRERSGPKESAHLSKAHKEWPWRGKGVQTLTMDNLGGMSWQLGHTQDAHGGWLQFKGQWFHLSKQRSKELGGVVSDWRGGLLEQHGDTGVPHAVVRAGRETGVWAVGKGERGETVRAGEEAGRGES